MNIKTIHGKPAIPDWNEEKERKFQQWLALGKPGVLSELDVFVLPPALIASSDDQNEEEKDRYMFNDLLSTMESDQIPEAEKLRVFVQVFIDRVRNSFPAATHALAVLAVVADDDVGYRMASCNLDLETTLAGLQEPDSDLIGAIVITADTSNRTLSSVIYQPIDEEPLTNVLMHEAAKYFSNGELPVLPIFRPNSAEVN